MVEEEETTKAETSQSTATADPESEASASATVRRCDDFQPAEHNPNSSQMLLNEIGVDRDEYGSRLRGELRRISETIGLMLDRISATTIAEWTKRVDEGGPRVPLKISGPVNRFPGFVRYVVQRLKVLCSDSRLRYSIATAGTEIPAFIGVASRRHVESGQLPRFLFDAPHFAT